MCISASCKIIDVRSAYDYLRFVDERNQILKDLAQYLRQRVIEDARCIFGRSKSDSQRCIIVMLEATRRGRVPSLGSCQYANGEIQLQ